MIIAALDEEDINMKISQVQEVFPETQELIQNA
jgi:hypothetical protein